MKNILLPIIFLVSIFTFSCKKCLECTSTTNISSPGVPDSNYITNLGKVCNDELEEINGETDTTTFEQGGINYLQVTIYTCE